MFTFAASGFLPDEDVELWLNSDPILVATLRADADGAVSWTGRLPTSAELGDHRLVATGLTSGVSVSIPVTVVETLAETGSSDPALPLGLAGGLMSVGLAALLAVRLRRPRTA